MQLSPKFIKEVDEFFQLNAEAINKSTYLAGTVSAYKLEVFSLLLRDLVEEVAQVLHQLLVKAFQGQDLCK